MELVNNCCYYSTDISANC